MKQVNMLRNFKHSMHEAIHVYTVGHYLGAKRSIT